MPPTTPHDGISHLISSHPSQVVFANGHETEGSLGQAVKVVGPTRVAVSHVILNPLQRLELAQVGVHRFTAAICLCDEK